MSQNHLTIANLVLTLSSLPALAADTRPIDRTQANQLSAIQNGRANGSLTRREYEWLVGEQARIADMERSALSDGHVSKREFRAIREAQHDADRHIATERSDRQVNIWRRIRSRAAD